MSQSATLHFLHRTFLTGLLILLLLIITYLLVAFLFNLSAGAGAPLDRGLSRMLGSRHAVWIEPLGPLVNLILGHIQNLVKRAKLTPLEMSPT